MRQKKAKALRKLIFGDTAHDYRRYGHSSTGCVVEVGPRGNYRHTKKAYRRERLLGRPKRIGADMVPSFAGLYRAAMAGLQEKTAAQK